MLSAPSLRLTSAHKPTKSAKKSWLFSWPFSSAAIKMKNRPKKERKKKKKAIFIHWDWFLLLDQNKCFAAGQLKLQAILIVCVCLWILLNIAERLAEFKKGGPISFTHNFLCPFKFVWFQFSAHHQNHFSLYRLLLPFECLCFLFSINLQCAHFRWLCHRKRSPLLKLNANVFLLWQT